MSEKLQQFGAKELAELVTQDNTKLSAEDKDFKLIELQAALKQEHSRANALAIIFKNVLTKVKSYIATVEGSSDLLKDFLGRFNPPVE